MNKKEIDNLEDYLKNKIPKIKPPIPVSSYGSIEIDDVLDVIKRFKRMPNHADLLKENKKLQHELEEKQKIIDEMLNCGIFDCDCPLGYELGNEKIFVCENCNEDSKKCWLKYFKNRAKERGKNE